MSSPDTINHWAVLGLEPGADASSLKRAFRQQARRWHPDLNGDDPHAEEQFKAVNEAYAVLSDPVRREQWEAGLDDATAAAAGLDPFASGFPDFDDYLDVLFNRPRRRQPEETRSGDVTPPTPPPPPPVTAHADVESHVELTPEQALEGVRVELDLPDGTAVEVWTPPMAGDGWRLRLAGVASGGRDHFLQLKVRTADGLRIDGLRVLYQLDLSPAEGALGCTAVVPTLEGPVQLRIPPGSSSGRLLRLRGRGLRRGDQSGDQLVEIRLVVPQGLTDAEEALYRRLQELSEAIDADRA
ncbi:MAG: J domain-containing protein [Cyanobacteria bacterium M_surface_10_m1_298]|nr:J domain-containing protein [Cyanobacteria bacterium M_surface_10_m1_298]MBM5793792.1 J domain-containing protein [Cyanobacteria bacterium K_DeepCast_0m_m1_088]